jgi:hypothetical protein
MMTSPWGTRPDELEATADMAATMATFWMRCRQIELRCKQSNAMVVERIAYMIPSLGSTTRRMLLPLCRRRPAINAGVTVNYSYSLHSLH